MISDGSRSQSLKKKVNSGQVKGYRSHYKPWIKGAWRPPEHAIGQCGAQSGGPEVRDVSPVQALLRQCDSHQHLIITDVQENLEGHNKTERKTDKQSPRPPIFSVANVVEYF